MERDHYAILGLERSCTDGEIRTAYRLLARKYHPDLNPGSAEALQRTQELNTAYEVLGSANRRAAYDKDLMPAKSSPSVRTSAGPITQEVRLRVDEFLRGTTLKVTVNDPANPDGPESYELVVPAGTAPRSRFRIPREGAMSGAVVVVRLSLLPSGRFKARGSDLRIELKISHQRAAKGGVETVPGPGGGIVRVTVPAAVARGAVLRVRGEGLPNPRGGRGDLLVRVTYRPEVRVTRS